MAVAVASPSTSSVMLPERYQMYQFNNEVFYLVFSGNRVYQTRSRAAGAPRTIVSRQYLEQDWICQNLVWTVVPREIPTRIAALYDLALDFLPYWNDVVWQQVPRHERKNWSHYGATERYGDLGNKTYTALIELLLKLRRHRNEPTLWNIVNLNTEKKGDVIEGIMGVRCLRVGDARLDMYGRHADELSCWVYETWNENPDIWACADLVNLLWESVLDWLRQRETLALQLHLGKQRLDRRMIRHGLKQKLPQPLIEYVIRAV